MIRFARRRLVSGFTLIEIAVAVAILAVLMAVALPRLSKMMMAGNERAVMEAMRAVVMANQDYQLSNPRQLPATISILTSASPSYLDQQFNGIDSGGGWRGYRWNYAVGQARTLQIGNRAYSIQDRYTLTADPVRRGVTGQRSFFIDQTGVIRFERQTPATATSQPVDIRTP